MKIDRRSFLSFAIGGAAGTALSPLPWKLTDDLSIWTQMWPWTPVPVDGEITYENTTCTLCAGGCGIKVRKVDDRAVKIEGREGHPVNDGGICMLGLSGLQLLYGPTRIQTPLKKANGRFVPVSWETALEEVGAKLAELRDADQAHAVGCISGSRFGTIAALWQRLLTAYGSPHFFAEESVMDTYRMAQRVMQGEDALVGFDVDNADYIVSFGAGIIEGWGSPVRMFKAHSTWQDNNVKVIQFEPRLSNTAAKAAQWVSINPGTEAALALGMAHVIMRESLHNAQFTRFYSDGFVAWQKQVMEAYDPDSVSALTGVAKDTIVSVAREFARAKKPLALFGRGRGDSAGGLNECLAAYALNAIVGNINKPGGIWTVAADQNFDWSAPDLDDKAQAGIGMQRIDGAGSQYPLAQSALNQLPGLINQAGGESPLQMLFVSASNPAYALPGNQAVRDALDKIPYIVSCSSYMDETALMADLILPNHVYLERLEDVPVASGYNRPLIGLCKPVIAPLYNTMHTGDVILALAKGAGDTVAAAFEWESYEECLEASMGDRWDALSEEALWEDTEFTPPTWNTFFSTASGKFEFPASGSGPAIAFTPLEIDGDTAAFPLTLVPYDSMRIASGYIADTPFMIKSVSDKILKGKDIFVEVNPQTAKSLGLSNGQMATLSTPVGEAKVKVQLYEGLMPGVVAMPRGLGHTAPDPFIADKGVNYNQLAGPVTDEVSGLDAAWGIRAKLARA